MDDKIMTPEVEAEFTKRASIIKGFTQNPFDPVYIRLNYVTGWLKETGAKPEEIMLAYFNKAMDIATETRGVFGSWELTLKLHWHIARLIKALHDTMGLSQLGELPPSTDQPTQDNTRDTRAPSE